MTTRAQVEGRAQSVNATLARHGSTARVFAQARNGGTAVDLMDTDGRTLRTLAFGTRGEVFRYLVAMSEALWLLEPPHVVDEHEYSTFAR